MSRSEVSEVQAVSTQWKSHVDLVLRGSRKNAGPEGEIKAASSLIEEQSRLVNIARERASWLRMKLSEAINARAREFDARNPSVPAAVRQYRGRALDAQRTGDEVYR